MIHDKEVMNFGTDIAKQCAEVNTNLISEKQRTFPLKKKRFGELVIDENFFYHSEKLKKIDNFNAISVSKFSKSDYLFGNGDLVDIEDLDHLLVDPQVKKSSESFMQRLSKQPILNEPDYNKTLKNESVECEPEKSFDVLTSISIRKYMKDHPLFNYYWISTNNHPQEWRHACCKNSLYNIDLGPQKLKIKINNPGHYHEMFFTAKVCLQSTLEGSVNVCFDDNCILTISKETLKELDIGNKLTINLD